MSINKYLDNIKVQENAPGPFAIRLKYDLKQKVFKEKKSTMFVIWGYGLASLFFIVSMVMVWNPSVADKIHYAFTKEKPFPEFMFENPKEFQATNSIKDDNMRYVSDLNGLDEGKSYIIRKVNQNGNNIFYINEVNTNRRVKPVY